MPFRKLSAEEARRFLTEILTPEQIAIFDEQQELDFAYAIENYGRFRANVFRQRHNRLPVPDDVLQFAVAVQYEYRRPVLGICSLTLAWRL